MPKPYAIVLRRGSQQLLRQRGNGQIVDVGTMTRQRPHKLPSPDVHDLDLRHVAAHAQKSVMCQWVLRPSYAVEVYPLVLVAEPLKNLDALVGRQTWPANDSVRPARGGEDWVYTWFGKRVELDVEEMDVRLPISVATLHSVKGWIGNFVVICEELPSIQDVRNEDRFTLRWPGTGEYGGGSTKEGRGGEGFDIWTYSNFDGRYKRRKVVLGHGFKGVRMEKPEMRDASQRRNNEGIMRVECSEAFSGRGGPKGP